MFRLTRALPVLIVASTLVTTACASSYAYPQRYPSGVRNVDDRAYNGGLSQGRARGEDDARRGRAYDVRRHQEYRNADRNYGVGTRAFRSGFETGYDEGYRRYASGGYGYPPNARTYPTYPGRQDPYYGGARGRYGSVAFDNGYRDGYAAGVSDARDRDPYDPVRQKRYRDGDRGYDNDYGSRDAYKRDYRSAFQRGYEEGYRLNRR